MRYLSQYLTGMYLTHHTHHHLQSWAFSTLKLIFSATSVAWNTNLNMKHSQLCTWGVVQALTLQWISLWVLQLAWVWHRIPAPHAPAGPCHLHPMSTPSVPWWQQSRDRHQRQPKNKRQTSLEIVQSWEYKVSKNLCYCTRQLWRPYKTKIHGG